MKFCMWATLVVEMTSTKYPYFFANLKLPIFNRGLKLEFLKKITNTLAISKTDFDF